jgi:hypothetical protein
LLYVCAFGAMFTPVSVNAAVLLGATVSGEYRFPDLGTPYPDADYNPQVFVVGAGQESVITIEDVTSFNIDFSDTALSIAFDTTLSSPQWNSQSFNGLVFTSAAFNLLSGAAIDGTTNLIGFDAGRVTLDGDELRLNLQGLGYDDDTVLALNFSSTAAAIPEPATWAMMVAGCGLMGGALRSSKRRQRLHASYT